MRTLTAILGIGLIASLVSCRTTAKQPEYMQANPLLQEEIDTLVRDLPHMRGPELMAAMNRLMTIGEAVIPSLVQALEAGHPKTRAGAAFVLGELHDRRVIPHLRQALDDDVTEVRYEVAASLVVLGDWTAIPVLITGLKDDNPYYRYKAFRVLNERTHQDMGYEYQAPEEQRLVAVQRWEQWYASLEVVSVP